MKNETRIDELTTRNVELTDLIADHEARIIFLTDRNAVLTTQRDNFQKQLDDLLATGCGDGAAGVTTLAYLHADHLGRPQFATDTSGSVIWDIGAAVTPFGEGVNMAGAFAQKLMFPGQYADLETGLSHNWHRTYDPTLGRYLQSDPIGLAGGLNRYAYVGGNPISWVDPTGEFGIIGAAVGIGLELLTNECATMQDIIMAGVLGAVGGGIFGGIGKRALPSGLKLLPNGVKKNIGEGLSYMKHSLRGNRKLARDQRIFPGRGQSRARNDWRFERRDRSRYHVESKFGKSKLTDAQRYAKQRLAPDEYVVDYWTYPFFGKIGGHIGEVAGGFGSQILNGCEC